MLRGGWAQILNKLRMKHAQGEKWFGVDVFNESISDNFEAAVWEPMVVKMNALTAASEAACVILSVDETVKNKASMIGNEQAQHGGHPGMGRGRGMM